MRYGAHAVASEFGFGAANVAIFWPSESGRSRGQPHCDPLSELCVLTVGVAWQRVTRGLVGIEPASAVGFAGFDMGACLAIRGVAPHSGARVVGACGGCGLYHLHFFAYVADARLGVCRAAAGTALSAQSAAARRV